MTLRVAFIGAGQMARHHASALQRLHIPAVTVGVHDRAAGRAEAFAALVGCPPFPSPDALFRDARPDIVHVCTPPAAHFEAASAVLEAGAHVYVEKPFALTVDHARGLLDAARARRLLVCAGHQLLRDPGFRRLLAGAADLGPAVQVDSHFAFRPVGATAVRAGASTRARQLVDVLPHPLYSLVSMLERFAPGEPIDLSWVHATTTDLQAVLRAGALVGRLSVSLRARPVASSLTLIGTRGSLTCDFVRSIVVGAANPGTEVLEKLLNPVIEGAQLLAGTVRSALYRVGSTSGYPGLPELIEDFYRAVASGGASPVSPAHLLSVTDLFERLVARIDAAARAARSLPVRVPAAADRPLVVVTGAGGFLGAEICRALPRVRGIGRARPPDGLPVEQWLTADLSSGLSVEYLAGANVVVHAAAETAGGYLEHQRNTIDATRHLLDAMQAAGVRRLVLVSSLSVLQPPRTAWERQDEVTPRAVEARPLGAYTWGKCLQEELVEREASGRGIATRIIRPGALLDGQAPALPGLMGRTLFGRWHLGLGRPGLPIAVCDVGRCAEAIAWSTTHFDVAPPVVNLFDATIATRGELVSRLRAEGWTGRMVWVPISLVAFGLSAAHTALSLGHGRWPDRLAAWSILRPRRYDTRVASAVLEAARLGTDASQPGDVVISA
jgi:predicted dehydrogenase/nucleoside-diphosphate-sugar epimerase